VEQQKSNIFVIKKGIDMIDINCISVSHTKLRIVDFLKPLIFCIY